MGTWLPGGEQIIEAADLSPQPVLRGVPDDLLANLWKRCHTLVLEAEQVIIQFLDNSITWRASQCL